MAVERVYGGTSLIDVLDRILDKGLVIDAWVRVSLVGIEILTIDARIVVASVDTYLRFAEAVNRLDLENKGDQKGLPDLLEGATEGGAKHKTKGALEAAKDKFDDVFGDDEDEDESDDDRNGGRRERRGERKREKEPAKRRKRDRDGDE